jgi:deoxyribonuclease V
MMRIMPLPVRHGWDLTIDQAERLQAELSGRVIESDDPAPVRHIAGAVVASEQGTGHVRAAVVVLDAHSRERIDQATARGESTFPYRSGLRSFRELPTLLAALDQLTTRPDLIICAAHGRAHPRRLGLACHLGLWLDLPTIGCALTPMIGDFPVPGARRGGHRRIVEHGEVVGEVVRTRRDLKPIFVSIGHRISLPSARRWILRLANRYRLPEPVRAARSALRAQNPAPWHEEDGAGEFRAR